MRDAVNENIRYVPKYRGNRDLSEGDQIVVELKPLKFKTVQKYADSFGRTKQQLRKGQRQLFLDHVVKIENYWIGDQKIEAAGDLYDHDNAPALLVGEIIGYLQNGSDDEIDEDIEGN